MPSTTLALAGLAALIGVVTLVAVGYAVYLDADARSSDNPATLGVLAAVFALPVVPVYVLRRGRLDDRGPPSTTKRRSGRSPWQDCPRSPPVRRSRSPTPSRRS